MSSYVVGCFFNKKKKCFKFLDLWRDGMWLTIIFNQTDSLKKHHLFLQGAFSFVFILNNEWENSWFSRDTHAMVNVCWKWIFGNSPSFMWFLLLKMMSSLKTQKWKFLIYFKNLQIVSWESIISDISFIWFRIYLWDNLSTAGIRAWY